MVAETNERQGEREMKETRENPLTRCYDVPAEWKVTKEEFPWVTASDERWMDRLPFDYGDIMAMSSYFMTKDQIATRLCTNQKTLEKYCQCLFHKSWDFVYDVLLARAKQSGVDVFREYAGNGNATALAIMAHSIMKLDKEDENKGLRITLVNDLGKKDED